MTKSGMLHQIRSVIDEEGEIIACRIFIVVIVIFGISIISSC